MLIHLLLATHRKSVSSLRYLRREPGHLPLSQLVVKCATSPNEKLEVPSESQRTEAQPPPGRQDRRTHRKE